MMNAIWSATGESVNLTTENVKNYLITYTSESKFLEKFFVNNPVVIVDESAPDFVKEVAVSNWEAYAALS
ncbi:hypothetical protein [Vibrio barjaei]|uniref:hypothetical protein n=1 Tax=Vibrio barjaei TaxID=1676683 RepID=UPI00228522B1|nr:hypothetical protein [Vibrio barjaei]MCY9870431.1 hypothetical protein [Vibrio barjaei]